ncbi:RcnB family protein [uncultured Acinetobacter sp.]|uniref:RcnB family protein n=1 Tax=uncultured Acinetobacter sp. TaxID=165433 RepID=UPI002585AAA2|nr:RcnB family protein [uncultured Acinetobacter sp.]
MLIHIVRNLRRVMMITVCSTSLWAYDDRMQQQSIRPNTYYSPSAPVIGFSNQKVPPVYPSRSANQPLVPSVGFSNQQVPSPRPYHPHHWHTGQPRYVFVVGQILPIEYRDERYWVENWSDNRLYQPPQGRRWIRVDQHYLLISSPDFTIEGIR